MATATISAAAEERPAAPRRALAGWVLFDWAAQPYYTLILTFLFAPYFANVVVGDAARGQAIWGYGAAVAGILIAIGSPLLGALADGRGRRKPWIALFSLVLAGGMAALWLAKPNSTGLALWLIVLSFVVATIAAEFTTVFTNSIMPTLVPQSQIGRLSGIGWGVGYAGGLISLALMAGLIVTNPATGKTLLGLDPLLHLDGGARESDRLVGPFSAAWYLIFMIPFFLFVPDVRAPATTAARHSPVTELLATLRDLPRHRDMMLFLLARAIYVDGLSAIFAFGGIYGSSVFGWQAFELGLFGIILTLTGAIGAVIGGFLDDRWGSKRVILVSLVILLAGAIGILSVSKTHVLFSLDVPLKEAGSRPFSSIGELIYLGFAMLIGVVAAPVQAASRSLLAHLAPPDKMTQFFGLFAFSGKVTAFAAPFLVATVTALTESQRAGMTVIAGFLITGMLLMLPVRSR
ncbi:MAG: MFS transporter [Bacteroidota bacterium]